MLHTNITDHTLYDRVVPYLTQEYNVVRFDLPGLGRSHLGGDPISIGGYVDDLRHVIQSLGLEVVYLVGLGFGGFICFEYGALYGEDVAKMAVMTLPCFPTDTLPLVRNHRKTITQNMRTIPADNLLRKTTMLDEHDPEYHRLRGIIKRTPPEIYSTLMKLTISGPTLDYIEKCTIPTLILSGDREIIFPQELLAYKAVSQPGIQYTVVPNSSSFIMVDQPQITARLTAEFFKAQPQTTLFKDELSLSIRDNVRAHTRRLYQTAQINMSRKNQIRIDPLHYFQVTINGHPVQAGWNQRYAKQIIIYLLFHPNASREQLCENLWPNTSLKTARNNLRVYLSHLRKLLHVHGGTEPILFFDREHIYLNGDISSDALQFVAEIQQAASTTDPQEKYARILALFRQLTSASYLTAIYDDWFLQVRGKVEQDLTDLAAWASAWLATSGKLRAAQHFLRRALVILGDHEEIQGLFADLANADRWRAGAINADD